jgi:CrcB protein
MAGALDGLLWVVLGAAIGGPLRFFVSGVVARSFGETFPWGTLVVNVSGALVIGGFAAIASAADMRTASSPWLFVVTGILGSYTTVSSFSLQTLALARDGERGSALANVALSLVLCPLSAASGFALGVLACR